MGDEVSAHYAAQLVAAANELIDTKVIPGAWMAQVLLAMQSALMRAAQETNTVGMSAASVQALSDLARTQNEQGIRQENDRFLR